MWRLCEGRESRPLQIDSQQLHFQPTTCSSNLARTRKRLRCWQNWCGVPRFCSTRDSVPQVLEPELINSESKCGTLHSKGPVVFPLVPSRPETDFERVSRRCLPHYTSFHKTTVSIPSICQSTDNPSRNLLPSCFLTAHKMPAIATRSWKTRTHEVGNQARDQPNSAKVLPSWDVSMSNYVGNTAPVSFLPHMSIVKGKSHLERTDGRLLLWCWASIFHGDFTIPIVITKSPKFMCTLSMRHRRHWSLCLTTVPTTLWGLPSPGVKRSRNPQVNTEIQPKQFNSYTFAVRIPRNKWNQEVALNGSCIFAGEPSIINDHTSKSTAAVSIFVQPKGTC